MKIGPSCPSHNQYYILQLYVVKIVAGGHVKEFKVEEWPSKMDQAKN